MRISIEEAISILLKNINKINDTEVVERKSFLGRVLSENVRASLNNPPFDRSPLDGYAIRGENTQSASIEKPVKLKIVGCVYAGQTFGRLLRDQEAVKIMTGAMIPKGANAVIRQEDTDCVEYNEFSYVNLYKPVNVYENYCYAGEDYRKEDILAEKNTSINAGLASVLASSSITNVKVYKNPNISVIATGDELVEPGHILEPGKIYDSNLTYISARLEEMKINADFAIHCVDEAGVLAEVIKERARYSQLIITTGGVSVGAKDILHDVVDILGANRLFWKVDIKPGTPTLAFTYGNTLIISLSGNPYGAVANFELLVRPVIAKLSRRKDILPERTIATLTNEMKIHSGVRRMIRGKYENGQVQIVDGNHSSGALLSMSSANCLIDVPSDCSILSKGEQVSIWRI